ncbi:MAG TPA: hypothetical protein VFP10_04200, partial [Candidatus Eisenbacteria bacterium]|nr:hypothetical protein [Candidatus Eisenbacteria bacterium]
GLWWARRRFDRVLARWCLLGVLAALVTPYGWRTIAFPFTLLTRFGEENPFAQTISEFVSPFALRTLEQFPFYPELPIWTYRILAVLSVFAALALARRRKTWMVLLWAGVLVLSAQMLRNVPLFVVAMVPAMAATLSFERVLVWFRMPPRRRRQVEGSLTAFGLIFALGLGLRVLSNAYYIDTRRLERFGLGWSDLRLPVETAAYARSTPVSGAMLNHLNLGGYFMWALPGPVFIDGRLEVVGERFYQEYLDIFHSEPALERAVSQYRLGWVVFPFLQEMDLLRRLSKDPRWTLTHMDPIAVVFVRRGEGVVPASLIVPPTVSSDSLPGLAGRPRDPGWKRWWRGFVKPQEFPFAEYQRGLFHMIRGEWGLSAGWLAEATRKSGGAYYETYLNLAQVLDQLGESQLAQEAFRVVLRDDPGNRIARKRLRSP